MSDKRWAHENRGSSEETEPPYTLPITVRRDAHQRPSEPFTIHTPTNTLASPRHAFATAPISASDKIDCDQPGPDGADRRCPSPAEIKDCATLYSVRILVAANVCTVWEVRGR